MTALTPSGSAEKHRRKILQEDSIEDADGAYAYVQMAPPKSPMHQPMLPRLYQQLGDRNQLQPYASVDDVHRNEWQGHEQVQNVYDIPKVQEFDWQPIPVMNLQVPETYDSPRVRERSHPATPFEENVESMKLQNLVPPNDRESRRHSGVDLENMDSEQLQLLVSQLQAMGVLGHSSDPKATGEVEELYPDLHPDDTYDTISDEEQPIYDDIAEPKPKPLYVNIDEAHEAAAALSEVDQVAVKVKPTPPPRIHKMRKVEAIPRTKSVGLLIIVHLYDM